MADSKEDIWASIGPEGVAELMKLGGYDEEQIRVAAQLAQAQAVRGAKGPKGRYTGRTYVAANPLEHLGDFLGKRTAGKKVTEAEKRQKAIQELQDAGRTKVAEAYAAQEAAKARAAAPVPGSGGGGPMGPPRPPPTQNPGMGMPPPQPQMPQPPGLSIPPPNLNVPQDQFNIEAGGDTTRGGGRVSVGGPPPPGGLPPPGISSLGGMPSPAQGANPFEGSMPPLWSPEPPMNAAQKRQADLLRGFKPGMSGRMY